jgi:MYXO-CTERM domain-containing protein
MWDAGIDPGSDGSVDPGVIVTPTDGGSGGSGGEPPLPWSVILSAVVLLVLLALFLVRRRVWSRVRSAER